MALAVCRRSLAHGRSDLVLQLRLGDRAAQRPITADTLFNLASLRKVFETTLLAHAVRNGEMSLKDPAAKYVIELQAGGDIRRVTLGQLGSHSSGLLLPQDHPPWPDWGYTLPEFIRTLNGWQADKEPGRQHLYTHAGFILLQLATRAPIRHADRRVDGAAPAGPARHDLDGAAAR
jgi:CubicO group peptidase (beta-lactamase class C family)